MIESLLTCKETLHRIIELQRVKSVKSNIVINERL